MPKTKLNNTKAVESVTVDHRDVNDNKRNFEGNSTANIEIGGTNRQPELLLKTRKLHPLLVFQTRNGQKELKNQSHKQTGLHIGPGKINTKTSIL